MNGKIWITWENQRRSIELARHFGCKLYLIAYTGGFRYLRSIFKTIKILMSEKPKVLFVQNPSMILASLACIYRMLAKTFLVVDRHTTFRLNKPKTGSLRIRLFVALHKFTIRHADLTIITNDFLADIVKSLGGRAFVLPDKLPEFKASEDVKTKGSVNFLFVSSFGRDEPIDEVLHAAGLLESEDIVVYISGNFKKLPGHKIKNAPKNVIFTGFLSEQAYVDMVHAVDGIIVLTTSDYTMLCGCYEAVSAERPLITSKKEVLEDYFKGAVFVENTSDEIVKAIKKIAQAPDEYTKKIQALKEELKTSWKIKNDNLKALIQPYLTI